MSESINPAARCSCCAGIHVSTPQALANRPGLSTLSYRVGTHASFFETMQARLSSRDYPALANLNTRALDDPALALIDAWAMVADVLTFYNERNVNEGYLRTATQRRSVLEMAQLVGYQLRPGVAASSFLAFSLDDNALQDTLMPKGSRAQSIPGPGELPQSFETSENLNARRAWNYLKPRMTKPLDITRNEVLNINKIYAEGTALNLKIDDHLVFVFVQDDAASEKYIRRIKESKALFTDNKTEIILQPVLSDLDAMKALEAVIEFKKEILKETWFDAEQQKPIAIYFDHLITGMQLATWRNSREFEEGTKAAIGWIKFGPHDDAGDAVGSELRRILMEKMTEFFKKSIGKIKQAWSSASTRPEAINNPSDLFSSLLRAPSSQPRSGLHLNRQINNVFKADADAIPQLLVNLSPVLGNHFYEAWANANHASKPAQLQSVSVLRLNAPVFGYNAATRMELVPNAGPARDKVRFISQPSLVDWVIEKENPTDMFLDNSYEGILAGGFVLIDQMMTAEDDDKKNISIHLLQRSLLTISAVQTGTRTAYSLSGKTTHLMLSDPWRDETEATITPLRRTIVRTQGELLQLAQQPIDEDIGPEKSDEAAQKIELAELYPGLQAGRWLIISGERSDIPGVSGIIQSELAMLANVEQKFDINVAGDKTLSSITLAGKLAYRYTRSSVKIYANVVKANHGETRSETLGAGDASKGLQVFTLKQAPLTYVAASNPAGIASSLTVYVNDVEWHETDSLAGLTPTARVFTTKTDDEGKTTLVFGNGKEGARLPTGLENIKARYRSGIGKSGNVKAQQISLLMSRPLGVKEVINPLPATGGADKETRDQARRRTPLAVKALDRLVSVKDYEDFSRIFAGIGKASAVELSDGRRRIVHITVAGADDIPIAESSDLYANLYQALLLAGDPFQAIQLAVRELMFIVISANIRLLADYLWESVVIQVRTTLLATFSFEARELGQDVLLGELITSIQSVPGVAYVDVDVLRGVPEKMTSRSGTRQLLAPEQIAGLLTTPDASNLRQAQESTGQKYSGLTDPVSRICVNLAGEDQAGIYPAQLALLTPEVASTLILNQIT